MANLTFQQVEQLWVQEGGSAEWAPTMAAIAIGGESGGDPTALNASGAKGLYQTLMSAQSAAFQKQYGSYNLDDPVQATQVAIAQLGNGSGISNWSADSIGSYVVANGGKPLSAQQAQQFAANPPTNATLTSDVTDTSTSTGASTDTALIPSSTFASPVQGADVKNFHGYDLSAIPANELGNAEQAIEKYITDPGYAQQLQQRVSQDYGYQGSWAEKIPQLNAVLIWAATSLDLSTAAGKNQFQTAVWNTTWWKTTDANQRSWEQVQGTDPAQAKQALGDAQEKVLADANQMGVQLTKQELDSIANMYAAQTFAQSGSLGTQSGTVAEWLDQAITDTVLNIKNQKAAGLQTDFSTLAAGQSTFANQTSGETSPTNLFGISAQLYSDFQNIAQEYLMYDPNNPGTSLLSESNLLQAVQNALKNYTGTGSSFGSSNLISGAEQQFTQQMMEQASKFYPTMAGSIASGVTPQQYVQPIQSQISQMLYGTTANASQINLLDPQYNWAIATPDAQGNKTVLTPDQISQKLVTMPIYDQSNVAVSNANDFSQSLTAGLGLGA